MAKFGLVLCNSPYTGTVRFDGAIKQTDGAKQHDPNCCRAEIEGLVHKGDRSKWKAPVAHAPDSPTETDG